MIAEYSPDKCEEVRSLQRKYEEEERTERRVKELAEKFKISKSKIHQQQVKNIR